MRAIRSPLVAGPLVLIGLVVCFYVLFSRSRSPQAQERELGRWLVCLDCGYQWTMDTKLQKEERMKDPTGMRLITCPKCHARRACKAWECQKCGKRIARLMDGTLPDGTPTLVTRYYCDECAKKEGGQPRPGS